MWWFLSLVHGWGGSVERASIFWVSIHPIEKHLIKQSFIVWEFKKIIIERAMVLISNSKVFEIYKEYTFDFEDEDEDERADFDFQIGFPTLPSLADWRVLS